ncbi:MAG: hypothetical protein DHS80DRAFT_24719 [Piptocephalis tieghemiana]|nr:MAG: hypothetical protein DHS80DRAFT_24719 [Piptocephalis tieghemiana]
MSLFVPSPEGLMGQSYAHSMYAPHGAAHDVYPQRGYPQTKPQYAWVSTSNFNHIQPIGPSFSSGSSSDVHKIHKGPVVLGSKGYYDKYITANLPSLMQDTAVPVCKDDDSHDPVCVCVSTNRAKSDQGERLERREGRTNWLADDVKKRKEREEMGKSSWIKLAARVGKVKASRCLLNDLNYFIIEDVVGGLELKSKNDEDLWEKGSIEELRKLSILGQLLYQQLIPRLTTYIHAVNTMQGPVLTGWGKPMEGAKSEGDGVKKEALKAPREGWLMKWWKWKLWASQNPRRAVRSWVKSIWWRTWGSDSTLGGDGTDWTKPTSTLSSTLRLKGVGPTEVTIPKALLFNYTMSTMGMGQRLLLHLHLLVHMMQVSLYILRLQWFTLKRFYPASFQSKESPQKRKIKEPSPPLIPSTSLKVIQNAWILYNDSMPWVAFDMRKDDRYSRGGRELEVGRRWDSLRKVANWAKRPWTPSDLEDERRVEFDYIRSVLDSQGWSGWCTGGSLKLVVWSRKLLQDLIEHMPFK